MIKIGYVECYGVGKINIFKEAIENLKNKGLEIKMVARFADYEKDCFDDEFLRFLREEADAIILHLHPSIKGYEKLKKVIEDVKVPVFSIEYGGENLSKNVGFDEISNVATYFLQGGVENFENMLIYIGNIVGKCNLPYKKPVEQPWVGIYHPKTDKVFENIEEYLNWYGKDELVGILFYRDFWIEKNLDVVNEIIKSFEERGIGVIPVFTWLGLKNQYSGMEEFGFSEEDVISKFFMIDDKPIISLLVNLQDFSLTSRAIGAWCEGTGESGVLLSKLNVPVIKGVISYYKTVEEWERDKDGIDIMSLAMAVSMPEVDGVIEPIVVGAVKEEYDESMGTATKSYVPIKSQIDYLVERAIKWINLRKKDNKEKKVVFILHNNPCAGAETTIGLGFGLDTFESIVRVLKRMKKAGYDIKNIPESGEELIKLIKERKAFPEFRWTPISEIVERGGVVDFVEPDRYIEYFKSLPEDAQKRVIETWGDPEELIKKLKNGEDIKEEQWNLYLTKLSMGLYNGKIPIVGLKFGNVAIIPQPKRGCAGPRCDGKVCKILHDPDCPPTHQWLATYWWIENVFKADIVIHVGTHGYLEFLPGKMCGLSKSCFPQISISKLPHLYVYNINNPMEGVIAKRRSYAVIIDHLTPIMSPTESYNELGELEDLLEEYQKAKFSNDKDRCKVLYEMIVDVAKKLNLYKEFKSEDEFVEYLHEKLHLITETQFRDGLHILGDVPKGKDLAKLIVSIIRFDSGNYPSIRRALAECLEIDYDDLINNPTKFNKRLQMSNEKILRLLTEYSLKIMEKLVDNKKLSNEEIIDVVSEVIKREIPKDVRKKLIKSIKFGLSLIPKVEGTEEIENLLRGMNGEYIEPGAAGSLIRGKVEVLPTGRNFYAIDPMRIPTPSAWRIGVKLAEELINKYKEEYGKYPETIGIVEWCIDTFRADGEGIAQILYILGVKPIWDPESGCVVDVEPIPIEELKRPRIDVLVRVDGIFRDTTPNLMALIDKAVKKVASLDESPDINYVKKHVLERIKELEREGLDRKRAFRYATYRVFSEKLGSYGAGANLAVYASAWKTKEDIGEVWIDWASYAYGEDGKAHVPSELKSILKHVDLTYQKLESDDFDICDCCCFFGYHGGMHAAAESLSNKKLPAYFGDTRNPDKVEIRTMEEEIERVVFSRLLNPQWIEGKKRHRFKGASEISERVGRIYGWAASAGVVKDWIFEKIAETFILDDDMRKWFMETNPWALEEMTRRLIESIERKIWNAPKEIAENLKRVYYEIEGLFEEEMISKGNYQGGDIVVITKKELENHR